MYNTKKYVRFIEECLRWGLSDTAAALLLTAVLEDLGIVVIGEEKEIVDSQKVKRLKMNVGKTAISLSYPEKLLAIGFDSKRDKDSRVKKEYKIEGDTKTRTKIERDTINHLTFTRGVTLFN